MRLAKIVTSLAFATGAPLLVGGCSGSASGPLSMPSDMTRLQSHRFAADSRLTPSGRVQREAGVKSFNPFVGNANPTGRPRADVGNVYISDISGGVKILENKAYTPDGAITDGITNTPDGEWTDVKKNLYVTVVGHDVLEYSCRKNKCSTPPSFTYSSGLAGPVNVTTDKSGNVFVADYWASAVVEYAQHSNTALQQCTISAYAPYTSVTGVAVDSSTGDVYVAYGDSGTHGNIEKFAGGLSGCNGTVLGVTIGQPGDLILDNQKNIIVCDQWLHSVEVVAPPYSSITKTIGSGWLDPFQPALEKHGKRMLLYVEDSSAGPSSTGWVQVFKYPSGTLVATLSGSSYNLSDPYGVTDTFNYVP